MNIKIWVIWSGEKENDAKKPKKSDGKPDNYSIAAAILLLICNNQRIIIYWCSELKKVIPAFHHWSRYCAEFSLKYN